jgi:hypothetical protein
MLGLGVTAILLNMDTREIEAWALEVVERVKSDQQLEDRRVELKREWPRPEEGKYHRTARQLAGLANANYPNSVLWVIGVDERRRLVVGADAVETSQWWSMVASCFDGDPPDLADVAVTVGDRTVVALCFETTTAPYMVNNPLAKSSGHEIAREVPWREGTKVRTIRKHELRTLLAPRMTVPDILIHGASLTVHTRQGEDSQQTRSWTGELVWSVESLVPKRLTFPLHKMTLCVDLPESGYSGIDDHPWFDDARRLSKSDGMPDVRCVGDYIIIDGPGIMMTRLMQASGSAPLPSSLEGPAVITLTMAAPGLPSPVVIRADLKRHATQANKWVLSIPGAPQLP